MTRAALQTAAEVPSLEAIATVIYPSFPAVHLDYARQPLGPQAWHDDALDKANRFWRSSTRQESDVTTPSKPFMVVLDLTDQAAYNAITSALLEYEATRSPAAEGEEYTARANANHSDAVQLATAQAAAARTDAEAARSLYDDIERQLDES